MACGKLISADLPTVKWCDNQGASRSTSSAVGSRERYDRSVHWKPLSVLQRHPMITRIEALNFRCLRYVSQPLDKFHVLVGPNGSGKSSFLDVVGFVSRLLNGGLQAAIEGEFPTESFDPADLMFNKNGEGFELALEGVASHPDGLNDVQKHLRYELSVGVSTETQPFIREERLSCLQDKAFSIETEKPNATLMRGFGNTVVKSSHTDPAFTFFSEDNPDEVALTFPSDRTNSRSAMSFLNILGAEDFPGSSSFIKLVSQGVQKIELDRQRLRMPSPRKYSLGFRADGGSLPWLVKRIEGTLAYDDWISHVRTALPEVKGVRTILNEEDGRRYLKVQYATDLEIPQWMVSDGTLRLLTLTLPAFLGEPSGILLVEEPENGLHPKALETVFQALSYIPDKQVLMTTHSPQLLMLAELPQILCFAKDSAGAVDIVSGDLHPTLKDWQHDISLGTLFASGALE